MPRNDLSESKRVERNRSTAVLQLLSYKNVIIFLFLITYFDLGFQIFSWFIIGPRFEDDPLLIISTKLVSVMRGEVQIDFYCK